MPRHPKSSGVIFDNGAADGKPHPKSSGLGGMERRKDVLDTFWRNPDAGVADGHRHLPLFDALRADDAVKGAALTLAIASNSVQHEVEYDLLQLHLIADDAREVGRQFQPQPAACPFRSRQDDDLADGFGQIQWLLGRFGHSECPDAANDFASRVAASARISRVIHQGVNKLRFFRRLTCRPKGLLRSEYNPSAALKYCQPARR